MASPGLEAVLTAAATAEPADRIGYRDQLVAFDADAIEPVSEWLSDARLGAFAVRVLERLAREAQTRDAAVAALASAPTVATSELVERDAADALTRLGATVVVPTRRRRSGAGDITPGKPGVPGRGYWGIHTWERGTERSDGQRAYVWAELQRGRLREGWGWDADQDLRVIQRDLDAGKGLTDGQKASWKARRMLTTRGDAIQVDDVVVVVGVPEWHLISVVRIVGPYEFDGDPDIADYGHLLPVELLANRIDRHGDRVSAALGRAVNNRTRLWRIDKVGGDIEELLVH